jgi:hypothetical protein
MPNGGSDCCATCWFNARNKGEAGYGHVKDPEPNFCTIRSLPILNAFYTYCGNHPHRRDRDPIPIGPVLVGNSQGLREFWKPSPDTEEIRQHLLDLLSRVSEEPSSEYPIGVYADETVVWQLGEFREARAVEGLRRVISFDPRSEEKGPFGRTRRSLIPVAQAALEKIEAGPDR